MSRSHHRGFPVVENDRLTGIFTQSDLDRLQQRSGRTPIRDIMTPNPISVDPSAPLTDVLFLLNRYQLSRLPITEGQKLVGIITRTDIIRVEVNQLAGVCEIPIRSTPSYVVYQTRSPAIGKGRVLLPVANPENASSLLKIALAIARRENYEIECLQVIPVPQHSTPSEVAVDTREGRKLLHRLERTARQEKISLHARIVVARSIDIAILETIRERHINLLIAGWRGENSTAGTIFGEVVDTLIDRAPCTVMLVKLGDESSYPRDRARPATWVIPTAGGPNASRALQLLPALASGSVVVGSPELWLCKIYSPTELLPDISGLETIARSLEDTLDNPIVPLPIRSTSVSEAVIHLVESENCSLVLLGASRESLLDRFLHGNIPSTIARSVACTVILVRGELEED
jgi:CIC family chloride channel protein